MKRKILVFAILLSLVITLIPTSVSMFGATSASPDTGWSLVTDARAMKAYPDLREYVWQKNASMAPNGLYDKIGVHRLVKTGITPIGVIFMTDCPNWGAGEQHISNPPTDNWTKYENYSSAIYWANRGFDVYAIDYRTHFVPKNLTSSQMSFAANWGWDVWISDIKEAANKVKEVSGSQKFYIEGQCSGGEAALNYATKYWKDDLRGIILLDAFYPGLQSYPIVGRIAETNTYNVTKAISDMNTAGNWSTDTLRNLRPVASYALQNPDAPAAYPPGTPVNPPNNPITNKTWANITEWFTWLVQNSFGSTTIPPGIFSNLIGGYGNISQDEYCLANGEFLPTRLWIENAAMADWVNCPDLSYDFNDHYNEIGVPVLAFEGPYANQTGKFKFVQGTNNTDFTGNWMPTYGHLDIFFGTYSARDISEPAYQWMVNHLPRTLFGNTAVGMVYDQNDANAQSVSYFTCTKSGSVNDIKAYIDGASAGNCIAAIYAVNGGAAGALLAQSNPVSIGTSFSWVDFKLPTPYKVMAGTTYGLAIMGNVAVNVMEVSGTGQRDHNAVTSYANGFANPFGSIWGTDDRGAMSIYATSSNTEYVYGESGIVVLNLPEGGKCNQTNLKLSFMKVDECSTKGAEDYIEVSVWNPARSTFSVVAFIDDNPLAIASLKQMLSGLPYIQYIQVAPSELEVWREDGKLIANLTKPVNIIFANLDGTSYASYKAFNFTLPAMTATFVKTGPIYDITETVGNYTGWSGASNWAYTTNKWTAPGFVSVSIPLWLGSTTLPVAGYYNEKIDLVVTKP